MILPQAIPRTANDPIRRVQKEGNHTACDLRLGYLDARKVRGPSIAVRFSDGKLAPRCAWSIFFPEKYEAIAHSESEFETYSLKQTNSS